MSKLVGHSKKSVRRIYNYKRLLTKRYQCPNFTKGTRKRRIKPKASRRNNED